MFIGHYGVGFAAKKLDSRPSLGTMFMASQWVDLIWPVLLLLGIEEVKVDPGNTAFTPLAFVYYPFSHGFLSVMIWAALFAGIYFIIKRNAKGALILGGLVLSHWILDWITHRPDLPLIPGSDVKAGLGLWNSIIATVIIEGSIFIGGVWLYSKAKRATGKKGAIEFWGLVLFLILFYVMNLFGPPPPSEEPIAYIGLAQWIFVIWAYWIDRNRTKRIDQS